MVNNPDDRTRTPMYDVHSLILNRWSPRSITGEELTDEVLMNLFEAARWAPSSYNNQPWRFIYAKRNTEHWNRFFNLLVEGNKVWAKNAAALVVVIARKNFEHNEKPAQTNQFDTAALTKAGVAKTPFDSSSLPTINSLVQLFYKSAHITLLLFFLKKVAS